ncbi:ATPase [Falsihalocynthiibacter sp. S25ZX9]|uniref:ATPase n=1 Tax=Falsihalocynthiibacter sp. S25ZX9 TaxID=3240870 RepID=UPI00350F5F3C
MIPSAQEWSENPNKHALLFGMSGLGKTYISNMLRASGDWFHYSIDYRIGTRYMGEFIVDNFKAHALLDPFLAELLLSDSIYIASNLTFENLAPLSTYLGKPGSSALGGLPIDEYMRRQKQHHIAEVSALMDTPYFIKRATELYGYDNFICDSGGSICEVVDPWNPLDPTLKTLSDSTLMIWIEGGNEHTEALIARFNASPKPMCYQASFLLPFWDEYLKENSVKPEDVNPNDFIRAAYRAALTARQPRYQAMADNWGISVPASEVARLKSPDDFNALVSDTLENRS